MTTQGTGRGHGTAVRAGVVAVLLAVATLLLSGGPADAHPAVAASSPADGAVLHPAPTEISITFGEDVEAPLGSIRVYDAGSRRVDNDDARVSGPDGRTVVASLPPDLPDGAYVIIWRAIGLDDGHLVLGQQHFVVGHDAGGVVGHDAAGIVGLDTPAVVGHDAWLRVARATSTSSGLAAVVAAGLVWFELLLLAGRDERWRGARRSLTVAVRGMAVLGATTALLTIAALAMVRSAAFATPLAVALADAIASPGGTTTLARALLLAPLASTLLLGERWFVLGATSLAAGTIALDGHVDGVATVAAVTHVGAAAAWAGGLVGLWLALRRAPQDDAAGTAQVLAGFSRTAARALLALAAAGALVALATVGADVASAARSPWGAALLRKSALVTGAVLVAAHTRLVLLPRLLADTRPVVRGAAVDVDARDTVRVVRAAAPEGVLAAIRRNTAFEALLVAGVVLVSGVLGDLDPAGPVAADGPAETDAPDCALPVGVPVAHDCPPGGDGAT